MVDRMDVLYAAPSATPGGKQFYKKVGVAFPLRNGPGFSLEIELLPVGSPPENKYRFLMSPARESQQQHPQAGNWQSGQRVPPAAPPPRQQMPIDPQAGEEQAPW